jgi:hypothetical protein
MAYYSDQGATIMQGVGSYFDGARAPVEMAFKDGTFGAQVDNPPGALMSFRDGSLGRYFEADDAATPRSFQDGSLGSYFDATDPAPIGRPERYPLRGRLRAYKDGSFGRHLPDSNPPGPEEAFEGGIFHAMTVRGNPENTPSALPSSGMGMAEDGSVMPMLSTLPCTEGDPREFRDGILGNPLYDSSYSEGLPFGPPRAFQEGVLGLGAAVSTFVIDMTDPQWVKELKTALVVALTNLGITDPINTVDEDWYTSPYWNGKATGMTRDWANTYQEKVNPAASTGLLMRDTGDVAYPTVSGILAMVAQGVGITPEFNPTNYPNLYTLMQKAAALGPDESLESFRVVEPFTSEANKIRQASVFNISNLSLYLMGGVALAAVGVIGYTMVSERKQRKQRKAV